MRKFCCALLVFGLAACAGNRPLPSQRFDESLVRPWSKELSRAQPLPAPFVAEFRAGPRALTILAVAHEHEGGSKTLSLVQRVAGAGNYDVLLLEGFPRSRGLNPDMLKEMATRDGVNNFFSGGERSVAIQGALALKKTFAGAEPDDLLVKEAVLAAGFTADDFFGFYVARQVPEWRRDGTLMQKSFDTAFRAFREYYGRKLKLEEGVLPDPPAFRDWYAKKNGERFQAREISEETVAPYVDGALFTQRVSAVVGRVRDQHIVRVIDEMLGKHNSVLVVFGASHFSTQKPALEAALGEAVSVSDQPL